MSRVASSLSIFLVCVAVFVCAPYAQAQFFSSSESITASPVRVDLLINANSYTPSFYIGRSLPAGGSQISARALVFGTAFETLSYQWRVNGRNHSAAVGADSNQIVFKPGLDTEMRVEVLIYTPDGTLIGQQSTVIPLVEPEIHYYELNPLHGVIPVTLKSPYYFLNNEITLRAEPYFFSAAAEVLGTQWQVDGEDIDSDENPFELSLVKTMDNGEAVVSFNSVNTRDYTEAADAIIKLTY